MTKLKNALIKFFKSFTLFEILFLSTSLISIIVVSILCKSDALSFAFSIVALFAVFAVSKGVFIAPIYQIAMCALYAAQAYYNGLYGECLLNAALLIPLQIATMINWALNKKKNGEIQINRISAKEWLCIAAVAVGLIVPVFFLLRAFNTNYLYFSVATFIIPIVSYYLTLRRSIYQFVSYIVQNLVLIVVWLLPILQGQSAGIKLIPVALTFVIFIVNNIYGLYNWLKKYREQKLERQMRKVQTAAKLSAQNKSLKSFVSIKNINQNFKQKRTVLWNF